VKYIEIRHVKYLRVVMCKDKKCDIVVCCCVATLKHVAQTVAHVELSVHLVDVVFVLFDENGRYQHFMLLEDDDDADMNSRHCTG